MLNVSKKTRVMGSGRKEWEGCNLEIIFSGDLTVRKQI